MRTDNAASAEMELISSANATGMMLSIIKAASTTAMILRVFMCFVFSCIVSLHTAPLHHLFNAKAMQSCSAFMRRFIFYNLFFPLSRTLTSY